MEEKIKQLFAILAKIEVATMFENEIPNDLTIKVTTLISDYNESIKNGKAK